MGDRGKRKAALKLHKSALYKSIGGGAAGGPGGGPSQFNCGHSFGNSSDADQVALASDARNSASSGAASAQSANKSVHDTSNVDLNKC